MSTKQRAPHWRSGPPPSIGWWIASVSKDKDCLRWWNGKRWSEPCYAYWGDAATPAKLNRHARAPACDYNAHRIKYLPRPATWPERSKT